MNKKIIIFAFVLLALSLGGFYFSPRFYQSYPPLAVQIPTAESIDLNSDITFVRHNGVWCSRDDDFYPANNRIIDNLLQSLQDSALHAQLSKDKTATDNRLILHTSDGNDVEINFDAPNQITDKIFVTYHNQKYLLTGNFDIPAQPYQWFKQPLINLPDEDIEKISGIDIADFSFSKLVFYQATRQNEFENWDHHNIKVTTSDGIVVDLTIYTQGHSYWAAIDLQTSPLPTTKASQYVRSNRFLYQDWFFELPQPEGSLLFGSAKD